MKRELKRQIKQDEFVSWLDHTMTWLRAHEQEAKATAAIVLVLGVGWLGVSSYLRSRAQQADEAFEAALRTFHAPLSAEAAPASGQKTFATAADRYRQAAQEFAEVHRKYGSQTSGRRALYYEGLCRLELGQYDEAQKALSEVAASHDSKALAPELARLELAELEMRRGRTDEALKLYRQLADDSSLTLPRDHVLMALSSALEQARRLPEAREAYQRLADEFPGSVYAAEARRRADYLKPVPAAS